MKRALVVPALLLVLVSGCAAARRDLAPALLTSANACPMPGSCTTFAVQMGDQMLFGNNEDFENPVTYMWVVPSSEAGYGGLYFGYAYGRPQGGINDKGLALDGLSLNPHPLDRDPTLPGSGVFTRFQAKVMRSCATVEEAVEMMTSYSWGTSTAGQVLVADATGDAAIVGPGLDRQLAVQRKPAGDGFLVGTNFNVDQLRDPSYEIPCERYATAQQMLEKLEAKGELSADAAFGILDAVHQEGMTNNTLYSNVFDLKNGIVHLAYWYQYDEILTFNVAEEVADRTATGRPANSGDKVRIRSLFSDETVTQAERAYQRILNAPKRIDTVAWVWLGQAVVCGALLLVACLRCVDTPWAVTAIWCVIGLLFGVVGLLIYWLVGRARPEGSEGRSRFAQALGSATLSSNGATLAFLAIALLATVAPNSDLGIPLLLLSILIQLLLFRTPVMAHQRGIGYWRAVPKYILVELGSAVAAVACTVFVNQFLRQIGSGYGVDLTAPTSAAFLAQFAVVAIAAMLPLYLLHLLLVHLKVRLWS